MSDPKTLDFYSEGAGDYAEFVGDGADNPQLRAFMEMLPEGGAVLDFGCGHGWASAVMKQAGFSVTATDGSPGFVAEAKSRYDLDVTVMTFDQLDHVEFYDGLWVSFSLLHDPVDALPHHLHRLRRAAKPGAVIYLGLKEGKGEKRDTLGRLYSYFSQDQITDGLHDAGWGKVRSTRDFAKGMAGNMEASLHTMAVAV